MNTLNNLISRSLIRLCLALLLVFGLSPAQAADVELSPGYIDGTVTIEGVIIDSLYVNAYSGSENAYTYPNGSSYHLVVNVPQGGNLDYSLYVRANIGSNYLYFNTETVNVIDGATTTKNFDLVPGTITGTVTLNGANLSYGYLYANSTAGYVQGYIASDGSFSFPAHPGNDIQLSGYVYDASNNSYPITAMTGLSLSAGATMIQNLTIEAGTASISGPISLVGAGPVNSQYVNASGPMNPTDYRYTNFGNYALTGLLPGDYSIYTYLYFNDYDDYFSFPYALSGGYNSPVSVTAGDAVNHPIVANAKFINGFVSLSGSKGINDLSSSYVEINGIYDPLNINSSYGGDARDNIDPNTGAFDLVASAGQWILSNTRLGFYNGDPAKYLQSYMYVYDYAQQQNPFDLDSQSAINNVQLNYVTGTVTVNYSVEGGGVLSSPRLDAYCPQSDQNNNTQMYVSGYAYGPYEETNLGHATFVGLPMNCMLTATANVAGSQTTFGALEVEILPGTDIVVDIGGPSLTIATPGSETYTTDASIVVAGTATDDQGVASITVNGNAVTPVSTGNATDPNEVSFSTSVALNAGPNAIQTVATDQAGKMASDTRKVYRDASAPTLNWAPADGSQTTAASVTVAGKATDDVAISEIRVNGSSVSFNSTANPSDPNEVAFSTTVSLTNGDNAIQVTAKDSSNRLTSQTHTIKKVAEALLCDADGDADVDRNDIALITAARNKPATGTTDPRDADHDGRITVLDARICVLRITP